MSSLKFKVIVATLSITAFNSFSNNLEGKPGVSPLDVAAAENMIDRCDAELFYSRKEKCLVILAPKCDDIGVTDHNIHMGNIRNLKELRKDQASIFSGLVKPLIGPAFEAKFIKSEMGAIVRWDGELLCQHLTRISFR